TSANLITNVIHALAMHPAEADKLRPDPTLLSAAVEETLRWDPPVPLNSRVATADTELSGTPIKAGDWVYVLIGAANRDPDVFDQAESYVIDRPNHPPHLSFGQGLH